MHFEVGLHCSTAVGAGSGRECPSLPRVMLAMSDQQDRRRCDGRSGAERCGDMARRSGAKRGRSGAETWNAQKTSRRLFIGTKQAYMCVCHGLSQAVTGHVTAEIPRQYKTERNRERERKRRKKEKNKTRRALGNTRQTDTVHNGGPGRGPVTLFEMCMCMCMCMWHRRMWH